MQDNEIYTTGIEPGQQPENGGKKNTGQKRKVFLGRTVYRSDYVPFSSEQRVCGKPHPVCP